MRFYAPGFVFLLLVSYAGAALHAQEPVPAERPRGEFFSGTITSLEADTVTVVRTVLGKNSETRTFAITPETKVEGKLRVRVRVTVRYIREEETDRALHVIVRPPKK